MSLDSNIFSIQPTVFRAGNESPRLFPVHPDPNDPAVETLNVRIATLDCSPLYGRGRGFHISDLDIRSFTATITFGLVMFADLHEPSVTSWVYRFVAARFGVKYLTDPDFMAERICEAIKELPVEFCQKFYGMSEVSRNKTRLKLKSFVCLF
jgi:hypothetical protein